MERTPLARAADRGILVLVAALGVYLLAQLLDFAHGRDQAIFAVVGDRILAGGAPYIDAWDFKTPGIYGVYALAQGLFGSTVRAIRWLEVGAILMMGGAFVALSRRAGLGAGSGLASALVATLSWVELGFWHTAQPESFAVPVLAWALVAATRAPGGHPWRSEVLAGGLFCAAGLLKPPLGGGIVTSLLLTAAAGRPRWRTACAYGAGAAGVLGITAAWLGARGGLEAAYQTLFVWTPHYTGLGSNGPGLTAAGNAVYSWLVGFSPFHAPGIALWLMLGRRTTVETRIAWHLAGVLSMGLIGIVLQNKFFDYHFGAVIPLSGLLAGWGYARAWRGLRSSPAGLALAGGGILAILLGAVPTREKGPMELWHQCAVRMRLWSDPAGTRDLRDELYSFPGSPAGPRRRVAEWLQAHVQPGESLFVWGFEPGIYFESRLRPATRYVYNVAQRVDWGTDEARTQLLAELESDPPAAVVVQSGDALPWVTGNDDDSRAAKAGFPAFEAWLATGYVDALRDGPFEVLLRADSRR